ncbi:ECF transporter S component (folate family) [Weissella uvarum]|uniref:folate family ECF transporter S component n=1 Tax=Weissella uvarum TaxID=1479233 RepID=UPI00195F300B|nr:folate family ECF transporter S component [Weissella uvarum]MBM7617180.1 ECF transporter S component (folate family) [Weissella uvarum]MCM0595476.1 folate family ECF transporter S component [Weissella uvarum]
MKTFKQSFPRLNARQLALMALLAALLIILNRVQIGPDWLKIGFTFIPLGLLAKWYGPVWTTLVAIICDLISATLLSAGQPFFLGFTLSAAVSALIYGLAFYNHPHLSWARIIITTGLVLLIVNVFLNTIWVITLQNAWNNEHMIMTMVTARAMKQIIFWPIQSVLLYWILNNQSLNRLQREIFPQF